MYSYKRERAKRLYPEPAIFNTFDDFQSHCGAATLGLGNFYGVYCVMHLT